MNAKLYVRNLSSVTTENDLRALFSQLGTVVFVDIIKDRVTGRSRGYGFLQMSNLVEAENAVELFNGRRLDDSELRVGFTQSHQRRDIFREQSPRSLSRSYARGGYVR